MTRIVLDLDEQTFDAVSAVARARSLSVERVIEERVAEIARSAPAEPANASHRAILADLDRPEGAPERVLAETYAANRRRLLALVDATDGDMGGQVWSRASLHER